jgi:hypothetical protein
MTRRRYELTDQEWSILSPHLPNKPRGVPRVDDRRVINGILWRFPHRFALGGNPGALWSLHDLQQSLCPMAKGGRVGSAS